MTKPGSIVVHPGSANSFSLELQEEKGLCIGRKTSSDEENKLVLPFPEVSSRHAEIRFKSGKWTIIDCGSTNGTTLNGVRLVAGREYALKNADTISIARYQLLLSLPIIAYYPDLLEGDQERTSFQIDLINATILVADIKHFSSLTEEYAAKPEQVMEATSKVFETLNQIIQENSGQLEKIAGDAIMAYWSNESNEIDFERSAYQACLAALKLKNTIASLASQYWPFPKYPLALDMALSSGPVASGAFGQSQGNPALLGDTANVAFRLEKLINDEQAGTIIVESSTYELTKSYFQFNFLGDFNIKGRQKSVYVYQLISQTANKS